MKVKDTALVIWREMRRTEGRNKIKISTPRASKKRVCKGKGRRRGRRWNREG